MKKLKFLILITISVILFIMQQFKTRYFSYVLLTFLFSVIGLVIIYKKK